MAVHRRAITTNVKFTYADQGGYLRGLTKYLQYRDNKDGRTHVVLAATVPGVECNLHSALGYRSPDQFEAVLETHTCPTNYGLANAYQLIYEGIDAMYRP